MSSVVGIDLSSFAIDLVKLDENTNAATWTRAELTGKTAFERLRTLRAAMPATDWWDNVYLIGIEQVFGRGQGRTQAVLQRVYGAVVASVPLQIPVWEIHSTEWRKQLGLAGNASKDECALAVHQLNVTGRIAPRTACWPQDALDAYAVAYAAREQNAHAIEKALEAA